MEESTPIKCYSKQDLYLLYKGDTSLAYCTFRSWIKKIEKHFPDYSKQQKILTPEQVRVVFNKLGNP